MSADPSAPPAHQITDAPPPPAHGPGGGSDDHVPVAHHFRDFAQQHEVAALGMWMFLATEVMFFGGILTAYSIYRSTYPEDFRAASERLNTVIATTNTAILLSSSLTMALALHAARGRNLRLFRLFLAATLALGTAFLVVKVFEYLQDFREGLVANRFVPAEGWNPERDWPHAALFLTFYYILTLLHAVHMIVGLGVLVVLLVRAPRYAAGDYSPVEATGLYWHFVDIVWVFLFPLLYLIR